MWPSWVFGSSGFPSDRLPQLTLPSQKGNQWAPIGWGLPGIILSSLSGSKVKTNCLRGSWSFPLALNFRTMKMWLFGK